MGGYVGGKFLDGFEVVSKLRRHRGGVKDYLLTWQSRKQGKRKNKAMGLNVFKKKSVGGWGGSRVQNRFLDNSRYRQGKQTGRDATAGERA